ncbi:MAG: DNA polymerase/3'-5' exonuclease PolX [Deltaproteobacteria bacterium]|nr:DNA polymerase/3'-5' exonuclease PolX [Deltaproteobacteria bacterium]
MDRKEIASILKQVSELLELLGEEPHRARAYANAARTVERFDGDLANLARQKGLTSLKGIGKGIASAIEEILSTGDLAYLDELKGMIPPGVLELMDVRGLGPKKLRVLHLELGISSARELDDACRQGKLAKTKGFGEKSQASILKALSVLKERKGKFLLPVAVKAAQQVKEYLEQELPGTKVHLAGQVRRCIPVISRVRLVVQTSEGGEDVKTALERSKTIGSVKPAQEHVIRMRHDIGPELEISVTEPSVLGTALFRATGNEEHVAKVLARLNSVSIDGFEDEASLYKAAGMDLVPPELREGMGEVEAALSGALPRPLVREDVSGLLHVHTNWSDGTLSIHDMAEAAASAGYTYLGISDHSRTARYAGGLTADRLKAQGKEIRESSHALPVLQGIESDIGLDGSLDYEDQVLADLDFVIASVHSGMGQDMETMTERIIKAVRNPYTDMLGHPSGRLLLLRDAYKVDMLRVIEAAAETGTAIELNANPHRLDLDWHLVRKAVEMGVMIAVNPDAHRLSDISYMSLGLCQARKGWLTRDHLLNAMSLDEFRDWIRNRRKKAMSAVQA